MQVAAQEPEYGSFGVRKCRKDIVNTRHLMYPQLCFLVTLPLAGEILRQVVNVRPCQSTLAGSGVSTFQLNQPILKGQKVQIIWPVSTDKREWKVVERA